MTVRELIRHLAHFPQDAEVYRDDFSAMFEPVGDVVLMERPKWGNPATDAMPERFVFLGSGMIGPMDSNS